MPKLGQEVQADQNDRRRHDHAAPTIDLVSSEFACFRRSLIAEREQKERHACQRAEQYRGEAEVDIADKRGRTFLRGREQGHADGANAGQVGRPIVPFIEALVGDQEHADGKQHPDEDKKF